MATKWISPTWRMPEESNQSKLDNYSLDFNGTNEFVDLGTSIPPRFSSTGDGNTEPWSVSLWANFTTGSEEPLIQFPYGVSINTWYLFHNTKISFGHRDSSALCTETNSTAINSNQWNHIVVAFDGVDITNISSFKLYINTVNISISTRNHFGRNNTNAINIGRGFGSLYYDGKLDHVSLFDYALSQAQINYLYNSGTPQNPMAISGNSPIAYYDLGGSSTGDAAASSPNTLTVPNSSVPSATVFEFFASEKVIIDENFFTLTGANKMQVCTISFWAKFTNTGYKAVIGLSNGTNWSLRAYQGNMWFISGGNNYIKWLNVNQGVDLYDGKWHHCLMTIPTADNKDDCDLFLDGLKMSNAVGNRVVYGAAGGGSGNPMGRLSVGGSHPADVSGIHVSNLQVWLDTALTNTDIATVYNNGTPLQSNIPQAAKLKGWWKLNIDTSVWNSVLNQWEIIDYAN